MLLTFLIFAFLVIEISWIDILQQFFSNCSFSGFLRGPFPFCSVSVVVVVLPDFYCPGCTFSFHFFFYHVFLSVFVYIFVQLLYYKKPLKPDKEHVQLHFDSTLCLQEWIFLIGFFFYWLVGRQRVTPLSPNIRLMFLNFQRLVEQSLTSATAIRKQNKAFFTCHQQHPVTSLLFLLNCWEQQQQQKQTKKKKDWKKIKEKTNFRRCKCEWGW